MLPLLKVPTIAGDVVFNPNEVAYYKAAEDSTYVVLKSGFAFTVRMVAGLFESALTVYSKQTAADKRFCVLELVQHEPKRPTLIAEA